MSARDNTHTINSRQHFSSPNPPQPQNSPVISNPIGDKTSPDNAKVAILLITLVVGTIGLVLVIVTCLYCCMRFQHYWKTIWTENYSKPSPSLAITMDHDNSLGKGAISNTSSD